MLRAKHDLPSTIYHRLFEIIRFPHRAGPAFAAAETSGWQWGGLFVDIAERQHFRHPLLTFRGETAALRRIQRIVQGSEQPVP